MKLIKKLSCVLMAMLLIASVCCISVSAANDAVLDTTRNVTLTVHKYEIPLDQDSNASAYIGNTAAPGTVPANATPLAGAKFKITQVTDMQGNPVTVGYTATQTTAADGTAVFTVPAANQGKYKVEETTTKADIPRLEQLCEEFYVWLPMTDRTTNSSFLYSVDVYPKNITLLGAVVLQKEFVGLTDISGFSATFKLQKYNDTTAAYEDVTGMTALTTNDDGKLVVTGLTSGKYQFIETGITQPASYSYVINPTPITFTINKVGNVENGVETGTVVKLTAKNYTTTTKIDKNVSVDNGVTFGDHGGINAGGTAKWEIIPPVPADIATYSKFIITDVIDSRLTYVANSVVVKAGTNTLTAGTNYTVDYNEAARTLTVTFINTGVATDRTALTAVAGTSNLKIYFDTTVNATAVDDSIPNEANLTFNNGYQATDTSVPSDQPEIHDGGIKIKKVDSADTTQVLEGAEFKIYASEADAKANANAIAAAVTDSNGIATFSGLAFGDSNTAYAAASQKYYVVETKAPAGYELYNKVIEVTVDSTSLTSAAKTVAVSNIKVVSLPLTGGIGSVLFTVTGIAFMIVSVYFVVKSKKSKKAN